MNNPLTELEELKLTNTAKQFLKEIANWCKFLTILGFVFIALTVFYSLKVVITNFSNITNLFLDLEYITIGLYLILALLYIFPVFYLFNFSKKIKIAIQKKEDVFLTEAFKNLKSYYKFIGVLIIITVSLCIFFLIYMVVNA